MTKDFHPMLAERETPPRGFDYDFPIYASPKMDGIRALNVGGVLVSRTMKPIRNIFTQKTFGRPEFEGLDGELCVGPAHAKDLMQKTSSGVMSVKGEPDVVWKVFDMHDHTGGFSARYEYLKSFASGLGPRIQVVRQHLIINQAELDAFEQACLELGFEGVMTRSIHGPYKQGRTTMRERNLLKIKRFVDTEAVCIDFKELMHNGNAATKDAFGRTKRSTHAENKTGLNTLGALTCQLESGAVFDVGTGFSAELRAKLWSERETLRGRLVKFKHFEASGAVDAPRFPVFLGFRDKEDV